MASAPPPDGSDEAFFNSFVNSGVHERLLKDKVRTETYLDAIWRHRSLIGGKVVMDVGCGTGIFSIFCVYAGARRVYAVDASAIAAQACAIVEANKLSNRITVLHKRVEDVKLEEKVDVIISEWMGHMLLDKNMLATVIFARNKWLKDGGLILPSHATLYIAPVTNSNRYRESISFWKSVYGFDMSAMCPLAKMLEFEKPCIEKITKENVLAPPSVVLQVNCYTAEVSQLESITKRYKFSSRMQASLHGFAFWFDVKFNGPTIPYIKHLAVQSASSSSNIWVPSDASLQCTPSHSRKQMEFRSQTPLSGSCSHGSVHASMQNNSEPPGSSLSNLDLNNASQTLELVPFDEALLQYASGLSRKEMEFYHQMSVSGSRSHGSIQTNTEPTGSSLSDLDSCNATETSEWVPFHEAVLQSAPSPYRKEMEFHPQTSLSGSRSHGSIQTNTEPAGSSLSDLDSCHSSRQQKRVSFDEEVVLLDKLWLCNSSKKRVRSDEAAVLSTAPKNPPTHWEQTLIYFSNPIEVEKAGIIEGLVEIHQTKEFPRFLHVNLECCAGHQSIVKQTVMQ